MQSNRKLYFQNLGILICSIVFLFSDATFANPPPQPNCSTGFSLFKRKERRSPDRIAEEMRKLEERRKKAEEVKISDIFPNSMQVRGGKNAGTLPVITDAEIIKFKRSFDELVEAEVALDPELRKVEGEFRLWLKNKAKSRGAYPELDPLVIESYRKEGKTINDMLWDNFVLFQADKKHIDKFVSWEKIVSSYENFTLRSTMAGIAAFTRMSYFKVKSSLPAFIGTSVALSANQYVNSAVKGITDPFRKAYGLDDKKIKDLTEAAVTNLIDPNFEGGKAKYNESLGLLESTLITIDAIDLNALDRGKSLAAMEGMNEKIKADFSKFSKVLDSADKERHMHAEKFIRSMLPALQALEQSYAIQREEIRKIEEEAKSRGQNLTLQEQKDIKTFTESMNESELNMARVLARWKVYSATIGSEQKNSFQDIEPIVKLIYMNYTRFKDMDLYKKEFLKVAREYQAKLKDYNK